MARHVVALSVMLTSCGGGTSEPERTQRTLRVPSGYATIQAAVDATRPGDVVAIASGVYHESVVVDDEHPRIVIRGADRNRVVLDGQSRLGDGIAIHADGVAVENLTVRRYAVNGVVWSPSREHGDEQLQGWRGSYLTAAGNGLYGVYAFGSEHGRFNHVYASGHPDSGVYVGRCNPCHALVRDSIAEHNHVGYEATNASDDVTVTRNVWRRNRVGVQINSLRKEAGFPQRGSRLVANTIADNNDRDAPRGSLGFGVGVVINGGSENEIANNRIDDHAGVGIIVLDSPDHAAEDNTVRDNHLAGNTVALALQTSGSSSQGNCFSANRSGPTRPPRLQVTTQRACGRSVAVRPAGLAAVRSPPQVDYRTVPLPPPQQTMPAGAQRGPAVGRPEAEK
jgi:Periplasmic copper-binding protein (NosD)